MRRWLYAMSLTENLGEENVKHKAILLVSSCVECVGGYMQCHLGNFRGRKRETQSYTVGQ